jgi:hypothetical protein
MRCDYVEKDGGLIFFVCQILRLRPAPIKIGLTPKLVRDFAQDDRRNQGATTWDCPYRMPRIFAACSRLAFVLANVSIMACI